MRPGTTDVKVYQQIYIWHYMRYLYTLAEFFKPKYILDAGANVGFSTSIFKVLWPEAIIVSVEPDPSNFAALQRNTAILDGVHVINAGLWGKKARIGQAGQHGEWGKVFKEKRWYQRGGMQAYGVNDLAKMFDIPAFDMVKIDIEGAEGMVFAPDADVSWVKHTTMLSLEVHDYFASYFGLKEVSTRIDAVMRRHPEFTIVSDNEHVMYLSRQVMNELNTRFVG
jgi:FkbM family methyltransferase